MSCGRKAELKQLKSLKNEEEPQFYIIEDSEIDKSRFEGVSLCGFY